MAEKADIPHRYSPEFIFAHEFSTHYDEFSQYLPEFGRLKELTKISTLVRLLDDKRQQNNRVLQVLNQVIEQKQAISPTEHHPGLFKYYQSLYDSTFNSTISMFESLKDDVTEDKLCDKWTRKLNGIRTEIGDLDLHEYSDEINKLCEVLLDQLEIDNPGFSRYELQESFDSNRAEFAKKQSQIKRESFHKMIYDLYLHIRPIVGYATYEDAVASFLDGYINSLVNCLVKYEQESLYDGLSKKYTTTTNDIKLALQDKIAATSIAHTEARHVIYKHKQGKEILEGGFRKIKLGTQEEEKLNFQDQCFWVPATVNHEVKKDATTGLARYSFFVYGGVNLQPRINRTPGNGAPISGNAVGERTFNRNQITQGFQQHHIISDKNRYTQNHELLTKAGISTNSVLNKIFLPKDPGSHSTRTVHNGRHTNSYSNKVREQMQGIVDYGRSNGWTQAQYRAATREILSDIRQELRRDNIGLNKHHRPWATKW